MHMQGSGLKAYGLCRAAVLAARGDAQTYLVGFWARGKLAVHARIAGKNDLDRRIDKAALLQARLHDLGAQLGASHRVGSTERHLSFTDIAVEIANRDLVGRRALAALRPDHGDAIRAYLLEPDVGDVDNAIGSDVVRRIVNLIEQLLAAGRNIDATPIDVELADRDAAVRRDVGKGIAEAGQILDLLLPRVGKTAAVDLRGALEEMAGHKTGSQKLPIIVAPPQFVQGGGKKQRRIRDAAGDCDPCPGCQGLSHHVGAEVGVGRCHARQDRFERRAGFKQPQFRHRAHEIAYIIAGDYRDPYIPDSQFPAELTNGTRRRARIGGTHIGDDADVVV